MTGTSAEGEDWGPATPFGRASKLEIDSWREATTGYSKHHFSDVPKGITLAPSKSVWKSPMATVQSRSVSPGAQSTSRVNERKPDEK
jgi:hypothetical protein